MVATTIVILIVLAALDLWDQRHAGQARAASARLRWSGKLFLAVVALVFCGVEATGVWLVPGARQILEACRQAAASWNGAAQFQTTESGPLAPWAALLLGIVVFYLAGFWDYVVHRGFSHGRWFWFTHEYHHLPRRVCILMPGILGKPFAAIPGLLTISATGASLYAGFLLLGLPVWDVQQVLPVLLLVAVVLTASHSSFLRRWNMVHRLLRLCCLTTPQEHLLHHAADRQGNYGNFTTLWDRVFGTYLDPSAIALDEVPLGLDYDQDYLGTLTWGRFKFSPGWRRRFQISQSCQIDDPVNTA